MADEFCLKMSDLHVTFRDLLHAVNLRHRTNGFTSLPKEGVLRIFFALKNQTASAGFEAANLGTKDQHDIIVYITFSLVKTETESVYCAVRTGSLNITQVNYSLKSADLCTCYQGISLSPCASIYVLYVDSVDC